MKKLLLVILPLFLVAGTWHRNQGGGTGTNTVDATAVDSESELEALWNTDITTDADNFEIMLKNTAGSRLGTLDEDDLQAALDQCPNGFAARPTARCTILITGKVSIDANSGTTANIGIRIGDKNDLTKTKNGIVLQGLGSGPPQDFGTGVTGSAASLLEFCGDGHASTDVGISIEGTYGFALQNIALSGNCGTASQADDVGEIIKGTAHNVTDSTSNQIMLFRDVFIWGNVKTMSTNDANVCIDFTGQANNDQTDKITFDNVWIDYCATGLRINSDQTVGVSYMTGQLGGNKRAVDLLRGGMRFSGDTNVLCRDGSGGCVVFDGDRDGTTDLAAPTYLGITGVYSELGQNSTFVRWGGGTASGTGTAFSHINIANTRLLHMGGGSGADATEDLIDARGAVQIDVDAVTLNTLQAATTGGRIWRVRMTGLTAPNHAHLNFSSRYYPGSDVAVDAGGGSLAIATTFVNTEVYAPYTDSTGGTFNDLNLNHALDGSEAYLVTTTTTNAIISDGVQQDNDVDANGDIRAAAVGDAEADSSIARATGANRVGIVKPILNADSATTSCDKVMDVIFITDTTTNNFCVCLTVGTPGTRKCADAD